MAYPKRDMKTWYLLYSASIISVTENSFIRVELFQTLVLVRNYSPLF